MRRLSWVPGLLVVLSGCGQNQQAGQTKAPASQNKSDPFAAVMLTANPDKVLSVREALKANEGEVIAVSGRTPPENVKPFNTGVAAFIMMDPADLEDKDIKEELSCEDAATCPSCRKLLDKHSVRVEVVDQSGTVITESLEGYKNLKPGGTLTVKGKVVRDGKDKKLVRIIATGLRFD